MAKRKLSGCCIQRRSPTKQQIEKRCQSIQARWNAVTASIRSGTHGIDPVPIHVVTVVDVLKTAEALDSE